MAFWVPFLTVVVIGYRLTRRPVTVVKFHTSYISMCCTACTCRNQAATVKRGGWGGVGWGWGGVGNVIGLAFSCTSTPTSCYAAVRSHALSRIRHATLIGFVATLPHARDMREHTLLGAFS